MEENFEAEAVKTQEEETSQKSPTEGAEPIQQSAEMSEEDKRKLASFDRIYAERKELKERVSQLEAELRKLQETSTPEEREIQRIIEITSALDGLDDEEKREVVLRAKARKVSLAEARQDPNFLLWQKARRELVVKEQSKLEPSTKTSPAQTPIEKIPPEDLKKLTPEEREKWYKAMGIKR